MIRRNLFLVTLALPVLLLVTAARGEPIAPALVGVDINFSYHTVTYTGSTGVLSGTGTTAAVTFEPLLGGTTYPIFNLSGSVGGTLSLSALFSHPGSNSDVDGFFTTLGTSAPDLTLTGKIPALGIMPGGVYTGTLIEADVVVLEMYGGAGSTFSFHGYFNVTGGDLVTAGYLDPNETLGMLSWLSSTSPAPGAQFDFQSNFTAASHLGELGTVPEPATLGLTALAGAALMLARKRLHAR